MLKKVNEILDEMTEMDVWHAAKNALLIALILFALAAMIHN